MRLAKLYFFLPYIGCLAGRQSATTAVITACLPDKFIYPIRFELSFHLILDIRRALCVMVGRAQARNKGDTSSRDFPYHPSERRICERSVCQRARDFWINDQRTVYNLAQALLLVNTLMLIRTIVMILPFPSLKYALCSLSRCITLQVL